MFSVTKFVVAGVIVALFGGFLLAGVLTQPSEEVLPVGASTSPDASPVVTDVIDGAGGELVAAGDAVWAMGQVSGEVSRIDAETRTVTDTIAVVASPNWLSPTADALWVADANTAALYRIDLASRSLTDTVRVADGAHQMVAPVIADGSLWAWANGTEPDEFVEIDIATGEIVGSYPGGPRWWAEVIDEAIWSFAPNAGRGSVSRFDLDSREFTGRFPVPIAYEETCCIVADDAIWLPDGDTRSIHRFDLARGEVTDTLDLTFQPGAGIAAAGAIWLSGLAFDEEGPTDGDGVVYRIDPESRRITDQIVVGAEPGRPVWADGAVLVPNQHDGTVSRIDVESRQVTHTIDVGGRPGTPLAFDGAIWVPSGDDTVTRIATGTATEDEAAPEPPPISESSDPEEAPPTTNPDLLPGVDLGTEEVEPGVYRVASDGVRDVSEDIWHVAANVDGDVWLERHGLTDEGRSVDSRVFRLGHPEEYVLSRYPDLETEDQEVSFSVTEDGLVVVGDPDARQGVLTFDGREWASAAGCTDVAHFGGFTGPDGSCWFVPPTSEVVRGLPGTDPDEDDGDITYDLDELQMVPSTVGLSGWEGWPMMQLAMSGDGTIWATGDMPGTPEAQFSAFDGESWKRIPPMTVVEGLSTSLDNVRLAIAGGPGATLWASHWDRAGSVLHAWHWYGDRWAAYGPIQTHPGVALPIDAWPIPWSGIHIGDDDVVWLDGLVRFDGESFDAFDVPARTTSVEPRINSITHGPDGSLWLTIADDALIDQAVCTSGPEPWCPPATDGLYVITPEAVAATE